MPGYGDYKKLYFEEYRTMKWEGYDVDKYVNNGYEIKASNLSIDGVYAYIYTLLEIEE